MNNIRWNPDFERHTASKFVKNERKIQYDHVFPGALLRLRPTIAGMVHSKIEITISKALPCVVISKADITNVSTGETYKAKKLWNVLLPDGTFQIAHCSRLLPLDDDCENGNLEDEKD